MTNRICSGCGLVYQSPRMNAAESSAFYAAEYRLLNEGSVDPTTRNLLAQCARMDALFAFAQPFLPAVQRHLDIGSSLGVLLQRFQPIYHCQSVGIEPGEAHRAYAHAQGLTVYATLEELEAKPEPRFDLVSMSHVLEHLPDPVTYLAHLRSAVLVPDGRLLLEVPNLYAHDSFEVAHLVSYSPHALMQTVEKAGFEIVKLEKHGRPRSELLPLYLTLLARPAASQTWSLRPERGVVFKRHLGMLRRRIAEKLFPSRAWKTTTE